MLSLLLVCAGFGATLLLYLTAVFVLSRLLQDNSIMDVAYGPAFTVSALAALVSTDTDAWLPYLVAGCITLWASRLFLRILRKNWGKPEDARYAAWRARWLARGRAYFVVRSFLQVNLLQGAIIFVVALPFLLATAHSEAASLPFAILGTLVFALGLSIEALADWQLDRFLAKKRAGQTDAPLMTEGLFRYSRRPNYFGETLVWWGLAIMVLPLPYGLLALTSPLLITYIVTKVTGPMLEAQFLARFPEAYRAYMARTSYFLPRPPRAL